MTVMLFGLIFVSVAASALAQIALKFGMSSPGVAAKLSGGTPVEIALAIATQPLVVGGLALYGAGAVAWLFVLARIDVTQAYPFVGLGFIMTMALGALLLGEPVSLQRVFGTLLVAGGVLLVARS